MSSWSVSPAPWSAAPPTTTPAQAHRDDDTASTSPPSATSSGDGSGGGSSSGDAHIHSTLPSAETQRQISSARSAVVASLGNMVDRELQSRAAILHDNTRALDRQERDVVAATAGLQRQRERLAREADAAARSLKEVGHVQNWAEVLEREFLVIEDTVRRANRGRREGGGSGSGSSTGSGSAGASVCSCSECGRDEDRDVVVPDGADRKGEDIADGDDEVADGKTWSEASRSLHGESSTGTASS
ncbi:biogenesis of lysosome-related organelles complex 1 subunit 1 [Geosmithia morbida]|uniref:Biogenesis of lysosome-related organelles complex 1 subunit 1 n=1 Tax=Geosmithia morbida TaxID=1094350 RepID=A0A9P4YZ22_9HYPO|nr:biogenesis of lysosome-related organelles complex 1 subunit 1 [Geosmithia morbida]KAF4123644.1 biogenesis of lysosome-related organelles complex 1 subunit 1 [Geosmithia morbida]